MTDATDYAALVERLKAQEKRACKLSDDAFENEHWDDLEGHIAAFADMTRSFAEAAAVITALVRERDALNEYVTLLQENGRIATQRVAAARAAALEEAAQLVEAANVPMSVTICESEAERLADNIIVGRLKQGINIARFHLAAAIRALAKPAPLP